MSANVPQPARDPQSQPTPSPVADQGELRRELEATVRTRQELGTDYEPHLIDAFLERLDRSIDARIDERLRLRPDLKPSTQTEFSKEMAGALAATLGIGIPITAIAGGLGGLPGILIVWIAVALIWLAILGYLPRPKA